jgi:hypothetical protein
VLLTGCSCCFPGIHSPLKNARSSQEDPSAKLHIPICPSDSSLISRVPLFSIQYVDAGFAIHIGVVFLNILFIRVFAWIIYVLSGFSFAKKYPKTINHPNTNQKRKFFIIAC